MPDNCLSLRRNSKKSRLFSSFRLAPEKRWCLRGAFSRPQLPGQPDRLSGYSAGWSVLPRLPGLKSTILFHLDWPEEQTVGTHVNFSHIAATPPGLAVRVRGRLTQIDGRKISFTLEANDGVDQISTGTHERFIIYRSEFDKKVNEKLQSSM